MKTPPLMYYFPKSADIPTELEGRFATACCRSNANAMGPDNGRGLLVAPFDDVYPIYHEKVHRWAKFKLAGGKAFYIGVLPTATPEDFRRPGGMLPGVDIELSHGIWQIPVANPLVDTCSLEFWHMPDGSGGWSREVKDEFRELSDYALELAGQLREAVPDENDRVPLILDDDQIRAMVVKILQVNYDLTVEEMGALRLFDPNRYAELVMKFVDYPRMIVMMRDSLEAANAALNPTEGAPDGKSIACGAPE